MIQKLIDIVPYWIAHAGVALLIAAVLWPLFGLVAGLVAGVAFYAGREHAQWEIYKVFDWKGIAAPLAVSGAILAAVILL